MVILFSLLPHTRWGGRCGRDSGHYRTEMAQISIVMTRVTKVKQQNWNIAWGSIRAFRHRYILVHLREAEILWCPSMKFSISWILVFFLYHKAFMNRWLWDCNNKFEIVSFWSWFQKKNFLRTFRVSACWACANCFESYCRSRMKMSYGCFSSYLQVSKSFFKIFTICVFFTCFKKFGKNVAFSAHFVSAGPACVGILLAHAQHA